LLATGVACACVGLQRRLYRREEGHASTMPRKFSRSPPHYGTTHMDEKKKANLIAKGFQFGDAGDFLGLTEEERQLVNLRVAVSQAVRQRREKGGLSQEQLATRLGSSQSRIAKIEAGVVGVSLDLSFRALFALGGHLGDVVVLAPPHLAAAQAAAAEVVDRARRSPAKKHRKKA